MTRVKFRNHQKIAPPPLDPAASEHAAQTEFFGRVRFAQALWAEVYPLLWAVHAVPNGGYRHPRTALELLDEGVETGVLDVAADVRRRDPAAPDGVWSGFKGELKHGRNTLEGEQRWWLAFYQGQGFYCVVAHDVDSLWWEFVNYLGGRYLTIPAFWHPDHELYARYQYFRWQRDYPDRPTA